MRHCLPARLRTLFRPAVLAALGWTALGAGPALCADAAPPTRQLTAGVHLITAEIAATEASREKGLMFRRELAPNRGMLFVFERPDKPCMWMRNTLLPLSVAFIAADGVIVNVEEMQPQSEDLHCAGAAVPFALEMSRGWFSQRGLKPGQARISGLPPAPGTPKR
jgi:uncharacterized membrane protein (UPF0127 family)